MTISVDTHIILDVHSPKKDARIGEGDPAVPVGADDCAIWANGIPNANLTQQIVGDFTKLHRFAQSEELKDVATEQVLSMPLGGSDRSIGAAPPGAGEIGLYIGSFTTAGNRSHFLDRTFKRLIERWIELSKTGQGANPA